MRRSGFPILIAGLALVAGCSDGVSDDTGEVQVNTSVVEDPIPDPTAPSGGDAVSSGMTVGAGVTISDAIAYQGDEVVAVKGYVYRDDQTDALCEVLAESYPPQCGGATLSVENPEALDNLVLVEAEGIQWSEGYVTLFGRISDGVFTIDTTVMG